ATSAAGLSASPFVCARRLTEPTSATPALTASFRPAPRTRSARVDHRSVRFIREHLFVKSVRELEDEIATLAAHIDAAMARWLDLLVEFDQRNGWTASGCKDFASWISFR